MRRLFPGRYQVDQTFVRLTGNDAGSAFSAFEHARCIFNNEPTFGTAVVMTGDAVEFENVSNVFFKTDWPSQRNLFGFNRLTDLFVSGKCRSGNESKQHDES